LETGNASGTEEGRRGMAGNKKTESSPNMQRWGIVNSIGQRTQHRKKRGGLRKRHRDPWKKSMVPCLVEKTKAKGNKRGLEGGQGSFASKR